MHVAANGSPRQPNWILSLNPLIDDSESWMIVCCLLTMLTLGGSIASVKGFPGFSVYSASKAAVRSFARTWLLELKDRKIRVNVLSPGTIDTPILDPLGPDAKKYFASLIPRG